MTDANPIHETWAKLSCERLAANQEARNARAAITRAYQACLSGKGTAPTDQDLAECERLEKQVDILSVEMDKLIKDSLT